MPSWAKLTSTSIADIGDALDLDEEEDNNAGMEVRTSKSKSKFKLKRLYLYTARVFCNVEWCIRQL